ncbi:hypothetical protein KIW84_011920 [Lathyrus oleraceus]|uniref:Aminotransferase-like plant mobile domain-containing protein n=1 Tax=Pisum sativum TaxID=3888 RepID=A0A9D5GVE1_PEA|nr:hypothetical protein KIW84_011920 [Pisum sativum]
MSITLDDVSCLLHLPIRGIFWSPQDVTEEVAVELAVDYLGVSQGEAQSHVRSCRGSYYKLEWLYDFFVQHRAASSWAYATKAYLLMLVGSTIFADKTFTLIHEYFPTVGKRGENWKPTDNCGLPQAMRWSYRQGVLRDCLKWGETVVPYLPDICLRQFGYRQYVPSPPLDCMMATNIDVDWISYHHSIIAVIGPSTLTTTPFDVEDGYLEWYYCVSHPRLVPPHRDDPREVPIPVYDAGPSDPDWAHVSTLIHRYLRQVNTEEEDPQFADLFEALHISRSY